MANKPGGKMLLIITTCMSVIAAFSLFNNGPQHLLAGTKTALYNGQNVVYDSQKAGGSQEKWNAALSAARWEDPGDDRV